jgi:hypothetical protein
VAVAVAAVAVAIVAAAVAAAAVAVAVAVAAAAIVAVVVATYSQYDVFELCMFEMETNVLNMWQVRTSQTGLKAPCGRSQKQKQCKISDKTSVHV